MVPETSTASPGWTLRADMAMPSRTIPKPVVEMKTPSPLPRSTTLVSPVTMRDARHARGLRHGTDDAVQIGQSDAFLQDEADRQREGVRPAHGHVIDRAVHGERADIASREEQRRDDEAVGGDGEAARGDGQDRLILLPRQGVIGELAHEHALDQVGHVAPARAVAHLDAALPCPDLFHSAASSLGLARRRPYL
jgi:hypothetical protein